MVLCETAFCDIEYRIGVGKKLKKSLGVIRYPQQRTDAPKGQHAHARIRRMQIAAASQQCAKHGPRAVAGIDRLCWHAGTLVDWHIASF